MVKSTHNYGKVEKVGMQNCRAHTIMQLEDSRFKRTTEVFGSSLSSLVVYCPTTEKAALLWLPKFGIPRNSIYIYLFFFFLFSSISIKFSKYSGPPSKKKKKIGKGCSSLSSTSTVTTLKLSWILEG